MQVAPVSGMLYSEVIWTSPREQWKLRFTHDVLVCIEKGIKTVGAEVGPHGLTPCPNCYAYGICPEHEFFMETSFDQIKKFCSLMRIRPGMSYFDYCACTRSEHEYPEIYANWRERIERLNYNFTHPDVIVDSDGAQTFAF
jgi:hypothetical protein